MEDIMQTLADSPFTDNPIIWLKWLLVLTIFILSYVIIIKLKIEKYINPFDRLERKAEKARSKGNVIQANLVDIIKNHEESGNKRVWTYSYYGTYEYELNSKIKKYRAYFHENTPPRILNLYYIDSPSKLFSDYDYASSLSLFPILTLILRLSPLLIGALAVWVLGLAG